MTESVDEHTPGHLNYLRQAYLYAAANSPDPSTQNGALLVSPWAGDVLVREANRLPDGVSGTPERWARPLKYSCVEHAERNAVYRAARLGVRTLGLTMYCPWFACAECARAIIQAGVKLVVGHDAQMHRSRPDWRQSIELADRMLAEAGVAALRLPGRFDGVEVRFDGRLVTPH